MMHTEWDELAAAVEQICSTARDRPALAGAEGLDREMWHQLEQSGFTLVSVPEHLGGSGGTLLQAAAVLRAAARTGITVPLAETMWLAGWLLAASGMAVPTGPMIAALADPAEVELVPAGRDWCVDGVLPRLPWAASVDLIVVLASYRDDLMVMQLNPVTSSSGPDEIWRVRLVKTPRLPEGRGQKRQRRPRRPRRVGARLPRPSRADRGDRALRCGRGDARPRSEAC